MSARVRCGSLSAHFALQSETLVAGDAGGASLSQWNTIATFWGRLDTFTNSYRLALDERITHMVTARLPTPAALQLGQRLVLGERIFMIRLIREHDGRARHVALYVEEVRYL